MYFCIFCRWIQCRLLSTLATLRNLVKWMYVLVSELFMRWHSNSKGHWIIKSMNSLYSYVTTLIPRGQGYCRTKWTFKAKLLEKNRTKKINHGKNHWKQEIRLHFGCVWKETKWSQKSKTGQQMVRKKGLVSRTDHKWRKRIKYHLIQEYE